MENNFEIINVSHLDVTCITKSAVTLFMSHP